MDIRLESNSSLADRVYSALEQAILSGRIELGERLLETELAEMLEVSRAPLREALKRLHYEGLAETIPRRGTYVTKPSRKDVVDLLQVREELECLAARLAAQNIDEKNMRRLSDGLERIDRMIKRNRKEGYPHHDIDFHQTVFQASGNSKLQQVMSGMYRQLHVVRLISGRQASRGPAALHEHMAIFEALKAHDASAAESMMRRHLQASSQNILDTLKIDQVGA